MRDGWTNKQAVGVMFVWVIWLCECYMGNISGWRSFYRFVYQSTYVDIAIQFKPLLMMSACTTDFNQPQIERASIKPPGEWSICKGCMRYPRSAWSDGPRFAILTTLETSEISSHKRWCSALNNWFTIDIKLVPGWSLRKWCDPWTTI